MSKNDMAVFDKYTQRFERSGTSMFIRTFNGTVLVHEHECTNVGQVVPSEVQDIAKAILAQLALGQVTASTSLTGGIEVFAGTTDVVSALGLVSKGSKFSGRIVADCTTLTGYSAANGSIELVDLPAGGTDRIKANRKGIRLSGSASNTEIVFPSFTAGNKTGRIDLWVYIEDFTKMNYGTLYLSVGAAYTTLYTKSINFKLQNGWQCLSFSVSDLAVGGGVPTMAEITHAKLRIPAVSVGTMGSVIVDRMVFEAGGDPVVALTWDDGGVSDYQYVMPLLNKYRLIGNFSIIGAAIGNNGVMNETQLRTLAEAGHSLIVHGQTNLTTLSLAAAIADVQSNKAYLDSLNVGADSDIYIYPNGGYLNAGGDLSIPNWLQANGFAGAFISTGSRTTNEMQAEKYWMQRKAINAATVAATWLAQLDEVTATGASVCTMGHKVELTGAVSDAVNIDVLEAILAGIASRRDAGTLRVVTAKQFMAQALR